MRNPREKFTFKGQGKNRDKEKKIRKASEKGWNGGARRGPCDGRHRGMEFGQED